jgi:hypothetical protein
LAALTAALLLLAWLLRLPALLLSTLAALLPALVLLAALLAAALAALILIAHVRPSVLVVVLCKGQRAAARLRSTRARASLFGPSRWS